MNDKRLTVSEISTMSNATVNRMIAEIRGYPPQKANIVSDFTDPNKPQGQVQIGIPKRFGYQDPEYPTWTANILAAQDLLADMGNEPDYDVKPRDICEEYILWWLAQKDQE